MKVIFLDFDGVLNSRQEVYYHLRTKGDDRDHEEFCPIACSNLQHILDKCPDAYIVVSSIWRNYENGETMKRVLKKNGIDLVRLLGRTPRVEAPRGNQIQAWLDENKDLNIEKFVIIDDDADMEHLMPHLYQTDNWHGLQFQMTQEIIDYFKDGGKNE